MMPRIGFRRLLPFLFTSVHLILLVYTVERQQFRASGSTPDTYHLVGYQEEPSIKWEPIEPKPLTTAQKIFLLLNLPSLFLAIPFAAILDPGTDKGMLCVAMPFVPITWYTIGRWMDGMLGYVKKRWWWPRSVSGFTALVSTGLLALSLCTVTPLNHHRTPDTYCAGAASILWSGLALAMSLSSFYRHPRQLT